MQAKLLTDDHFREIAQLRNVAEVVTYLKKLPAYAKAFETVDENTLHRGDVEKILIHLVCPVIIIISRPLRSAGSQELDIYILSVDLRP